MEGELGIVCKIKKLRHWPNVPSSLRDWSRSGEANLGYTVSPYCKEQENKAEGELSGRSLDLCGALG